jgi:dTDP-4-amino-4,6-dideoxygalactose transaminase
MIIPRRKPYFPPDILSDLLRFNLSGSKTGEVQRLENDLSKYLGIKNPIAISSGRMGLYLILKASGIKKGSEIIIPGYTFGTLTKFINKAGYKPVPVDIDPGTFQMSAESIKKAINTKTGAILATHIFGEPCDIVKIKRLAKKHGLFLIEDCAESLGAKASGRLTGHFGDVSLSSFNIAKPLHGITGGLIYGQNKKIIEKIKILIAKMPAGQDVTKKDIIRGIIGNFLSQTFAWPVLMYIFSFDFFRDRFVSGYRSADNSKVASIILPDHIAHLVRLNLTGFTGRVSQRLRVKKLYKKHLSNFIEFQSSYKKSRGNGYMIVGKIDADPLFLRRYLALRGIDIAIKEEIADNITGNPESEVSKVYEKAIALPVYESLSERDIKFISRNIKRFFSQKNKN